MLRTGNPSRHSPHQGRSTHLQESFKCNLAISAQSLTTHFFFFCHSQKCEISYISVQRTHRNIQQFIVIGEGKKRKKPLPVHKKETNKIIPSSGKLCRNFFFNELDLHMFLWSNFWNRKWKQKVCFVILKGNIHMFIHIKYFGTDTQETLNSNYV